MKARWIRLGAIGQPDFDAACAALAAAQARDAAPVLVWAEEAARYPFTLIAPLKFAPGSCVATPSRELEHAFRLRLEAQHGWEFDHSWLSAPECAAATSF